MCIRDRHLPKTRTAIKSFNIRDLGQQLRPIGMLVLMEVVMMRVMQNRLRGRRTWIYFDELSVLFSYEWSTNFLDVSWKRYRKYGALAVSYTHLDVYKRQARSCWPTIWPMTAGQTAASRPSITNLPQMQTPSKPIG